MFAFFGKMTYYAKIFKILFQKFHPLTDRHCCVQMSGNLADEKSAKFCAIYLTKIAFLSNCRYCADRAQNLSGPAPNILLRVFHISSKSVYFRWSYSRTREHRQIARKVNPIFGRSLTSSRIMSHAMFYVTTVPLTLFIASQKPPA